MEVIDIIATTVHLVGLFVLLLAAVFSLACGLYVAAEFLEERQKTSFRLIKRAAIWCVACQTAWIILDRSALMPNAIGLASHINSWLLLRHHPYHQNNMVLTAAAVLLLVAHQTSWVYWWLQRGGTTWQASSVLAALVWPVPTMLLLSTASGESLPVSVSPFSGLSDSQPGLGRTGSRSPLQHSPTSAAATATAARLRKLSLDSTSDGRGPQQRHQHANSMPLPVPDTLGYPDQGIHRYMLQHQQQQEQQQVRQGSSKSRKAVVVRGFDALRQLVKKHGGALLPVTDADAEGAATKGLMAKLYND